MEMNKWGILGIAGALLISYNLGQGGLVAMRNNETVYPGTTAKREAYLIMWKRGCRDQARKKAAVTIWMRASLSVPLR